MGERHILYLLIIVDLHQWNSELLFDYIGEIIIHFDVGMTLYIEALQPQLL